MNPLRLRASGYRTFERLEIDLPAGVVAITGENGAGKSSLISAIDLALFGPDGRSWVPYLRQGEETQRLEIELTFEHDGREYRVRRGYSAAGRGKATLDLEEGDGGRSEHDERRLPSSDWRPLTRETIDATQALLEEILGLTRETFRASAFLAQGDGAAFTEAQPRDRKRILANVLGLGRYDVLLELVRRDSRAATKRIDELNGALRRADQDLEGRDGATAGLEQTRATIAELEPRLAAAEQILADTATQATQNDELRRLRAEAEAAVSAAREALAPLAQRRDDALAAEDDLEALEEQLEEEARGVVSIEDLVRREQEAAGRIEAYRAMLRAVEETRRLREMRQTEKATIEAQAKTTHDRMVELDRKASHVDMGNVTVCPTCEQELGAEARKATLSSLRAQAQTLADDAEALFERAAAIVVPDEPAEPERPADAETDLATIRTAIAKAREDALARERVQGRIATLRETVAKRPPAEEIEKASRALSDAQERLASLPAGLSAAEQDSLARRALEARAERDRLARDLTDARAREAVYAADVERLARLEQETAAARAERKALLEDVDTLAILDRAYGRDGIPALIIGHVAIPSIEVEANRILGELGGATGSCRLELRTEKALAGGGTADALDVIVVTPAGERPYETFSGGERTRLNLALRIALARLLANRRGAESRLLAIDEPEFLDATGTAALAAVLRGLTGDFDRVYLISHVPDLRDAFDVALEVVKVNDRSEVRA